MTSTAVYIGEKYRSKYAGDFALDLTVAVTHQLFGIEATDERPKSFLEANRKTVEQEFARLREDDRLCETLTVTTHVMANLAGVSSTVTGDMVVNWSNLELSGILRSLESLQMPSSDQEFMKFASDFEMWVIQQGVEKSKAAS